MWVDHGEILEVALHARREVVGRLRWSRGTVRFTLARSLDHTELGFPLLALAGLTRLESKALLKPWPLGRGDESDCDDEQYERDQVHARILEEGRATDRVATELSPSEAPVSRA